MIKVGKDDIKLGIILIAAAPKTAGTGTEKFRADKPFDDAILHFGFRHCLISILQKVL